MSSHEAHNKGLMRSWYQDEETGKVYSNSTNLARAIRERSNKRVRRS
jgi:hypothetical protein